MFREELAASIGTVHFLLKNLFDFPNSGLTREFRMVEVVWAVVAAGGAEAAEIDFQAFGGAAEGFQMVESLGVVELLRFVGKWGFMWHLKVLKHLWLFRSWEVFRNLKLLSVLRSFFLSLLFLPYSSFLVFPFWLVL